MSVSFYTCDICTRVADQNYKDSCSECFSIICYDCQIEYNMRSERDPEITNSSQYWELSRLEPYWNPIEHDEMESCPFCRREIFSDQELLRLALIKLNLSKREFILEIKDEQDKNR
jgi:hypothetical protein